ncbi:unnamed protein product [Nippostrongylus brasiliensis]|uniref:Uncharacterized protein n=1 Tax=Nippostrongylus brasiliensis TaxID=27835 RepID=A0A0N4Y0U8_NIPBR|nr:unnamed protein product [Nippostrongylus brasiliensis]
MFVQFLTANGALPCNRCASYPVSNQPACCLTITPAKPQQQVVVWYGAQQYGNGGTIQQSSGIVSSSSSGGQLPLSGTPQQTQQLNQPYQQGVQNSNPTVTPPPQLQNGGQTYLSTQSSTGYPNQGQDGSGGNYLPQGVQYQPMNPFLNQAYNEASAGFQASSANGAGFSVGPNYQGSTQSPSGQGYNGNWNAGGQGEAQYSGGQQGQLNDQAANSMTFVPFQDTTTAAPLFTQGGTAYPQPNPSQQGTFPTAPIAVFPGQVTSSPYTSSPYMSSTQSPQQGGYQQDLTSSPQMSYTTSIPYENGNQQIYPNPYANSQGQGSYNGASSQAGYQDPTLYTSGGYPSQTMSPQNTNQAFSPSPVTSTAAPFTYQTTFTQGQSQYPSSGYLYTTELPPSYQGNDYQQGQSPQGGFTGSTPLYQTNGLGQQQQESQFNGQTPQGSAGGYPSSTQAPQGLYTYQTNGQQQGGQFTMSPGEQQYNGQTSQGSSGTAGGGHFVQTTQRPNDVQYDASSAPGTQYQAGLSGSTMSPNGQFAGGTTAQLGNPTNAPGFANQFDFQRDMNTQYGEYRDYPGQVNAGAPLNSKESHFSDRAGLLSTILAIVIVQIAL